MLSKIISIVLLKQENNSGSKLTYHIYLSSKMEYCNKILITLIFRNKRAFWLEPSPGWMHYETYVHFYYFTLFLKMLLLSLFKKCKLSFNIHSNFKLHKFLIFVIFFSKNILNFFFKKWSYRNQVFKKKKQPPPPLKKNKHQKQTNNMKTPKKPLLYKRLLAPMI